MGTTRQMRLGIGLGILMVGCAAMFARLRWSGQVAALSFQSALAVIADPKAMPHERRAAAAILVAYCRAAVRSLKAADDLRDQVDLLLPQLEAMIQEPR